MDWNHYFYKNPYATECKATVIDCKKLDKNYGIILNDTIFYPEGGGQPGDTGWIDAVEVVDTIYKDDSIVHICKDEIPVHKTVQLKLNKEKRIQNMQSHSGEHIFSGFIHDLYGYDNVGFHMGSDEVQMDFNGSLTKENIKDVETKVNDYIQSNHKMHTIYVDEDNDLDYRSKKELHGSIRVIHFDEGDVCACCGMHVSNSGEIGLCKVVRMEHLPNKTRIYAVFGKQAISLYQTIYKNNYEVSKALSCKVDETYEFVRHLQDSKDEIIAISKQYEQAYYEEILKNIPMNQPFYLVVLPLGTMDGMRKLLNDIRREKHIDTIVGCLKDQDRYVFVMMSDSVDLKEVKNELFSKIHAKGGGSSTFMQGSFLAKDDDFQTRIQMYFKDKCID